MLVIHGVVLYSSEKIESISKRVMSKRWAQSWGQKVLKISKKHSPNSITQVIHVELIVDKTGFQTVSSV